MALSKIQNNSYADTAVHGRRNLIINGAMQVNQRVGPWAGSGYTLDRFRADHSTDGAFSIAQDTDTPADFQNSIKWTVTTADASLAATQYAYVRTRLEGNSVAHLNWGTSDAKTVTLSFYIRSSVTGTFGGSIWNNAFDRSYPFTYTISSADTWERKSITIAGDTSGTWLTDTGVGLNISIFASAGSTYSGTAGSWAGAGYVTATGVTNIMATLNSTFYITGVQLEVGSQATPFEHRSYGEELALCRRYYQGEARQYLLYYHSGASLVNVNYQEEMRAAPTVTFTGSNGSPSAGNIGTNNCYFLMSAAAAGYYADYTMSAEL